MSAILIGQNKWIFLITLLIHKGRAVIMILLYPKTLTNIVHYKTFDSSDTKILVLKIKIFRFDL